MALSSSNPVSASAAQPLHASLRLRNNLLLTTFWFVALVAWLFIAKFAFWAFVVAGIISGLTAGLLQNRSMNAAMQAFVTAKSAMDVRRAMTSTRSGRLYVPFFWGFVLCLSLSALLSGHIIPALINGHFAFCFTREAMTLSATYRLKKQHQAAAL